MCPACNQHNFSSRMECYKCGGPRQAPRPAMHWSKQLAVLDTCITSCHRLCVGWCCSHTNYRSPQHQLEPEGWQAGRRQAVSHACLTHHAAQSGC